MFVILRNQVSKTLKSLYK
uniref:Uncharacterized protein n=1 Tax=Rhizophora mucronata TaxID=61149 RepID=A0A2P2KK59_RHIMU